MSGRANAPYSRTGAVSNKPSGKRNGLAKGDHMQSSYKATAGRLVVNHLEMVPNWPFTRTGSISFARLSGGRLIPASGCLARSAARAGA